MRLKFIITTTLVCLLSMTATAQITLDSRRVILDSRTGNWLCSVPESTFGTDFTATFNTSEPWTDITIDGDTVVPGTSYTFANVAGDRGYTLVAHQGDSVTIQGKIYFTFYPIFEFNGTFNDDYQVTDVIANLPQSQGPTTMFSKVKHRGASTNGPSRLKRNYHIKFLTPDSNKMDRKFFGLRNDNSWILDAGQVDLLRIRNRVSTELWLDMCRQPYYADREPKALLGVRGDFIELFLNGSYNGIYALTEAMDRKQMKLAKYEEPDSVNPGKFHGMLWKAKVSDKIARMNGYYGYNNTKEMWGGFEVKYPDPDDVMPTQYRTLSNAVKFVVNSSNANFCAQVGQYFDIPVIMDYWIFINAVMGVDSGIKNIYWGVYDQTLDKKITLAAWDLDCTFGQNWTNSPVHPESTGPTRLLGTFNNLLLRLHELSPDSFSVKAVERYRLLRQDILSEDSLKNRFRNRLAPLRKAGALARETERWTMSSDISRQPLDFEAELAFIEDWIDQHMTFLDNTRFSPYIMGDCNRDGVVDISDVNLCINEILKGSSPVWYEDMNHDGIIDVVDINAIINIILGKNKGNNQASANP